jgi:mannosyl-3-phosphoglycerate phosphatase
MRKCGIAVFADLDGTILDEKYSFETVKPLIKKILKLNVCLVFCSSKTRLEIEFFRRKLEVNDPFISENGAAVFVPKGYFSKNHRYTCENGSYGIVELGLSYVVVREKLELIRRKTGFSLTGFGDMTAKEIAKDSGLPMELAVLAKQREYSEPFKAKASDEKNLFDAIIEEGLCCVKGGRYYHLMGSHNKGQAVSVLKRFFVGDFGLLKTVGVGNSQNDLSMLSSVDFPFFIKETDDLGVVWKKVVKCVGLNVN